MSYKSRRTLVSMIAGTALLAAYAAYAIDRARAGTESLGTWALTILVFLGISIAALIIVQILFHIAMAATLAVKDQGRNPGQPERDLDAAMVEDEMDRLIALRSTRINYACVSIGIGIALAAIAFGAPAAIGLHVLLAALVIGSLAAGAAEIIDYERGVRHG
ncbi:hypothetical protein [Glycomyces rhizosphaerae]|uniref:DUF3169 family protein n=1 Tax=Glycomyces rhizosphaerae TaxID=2054422 RepID=A0ABV7PVL8_9ACTN